MQFHKFPESFEFFEPPRKVYHKAKRGFYYNLLLCIHKYLCKGKLVIKYDTNTYVHIHTYICWRLGHKLRILRHVHGRCIVLEFTDTCTYYIHTYLHTYKHDRSLPMCSTSHTTKHKICNRYTHTYPLSLFRNACILKGPYPPPRMIRPWWWSAPMRTWTHSEMHCPTWLSKCRHP